MDDTLHCPVCGNKLRNIRSNYIIPNTGKVGNYIERTCSKGMNHTLQLFANEETGKVDLLKLSLDPKYSRFVEIDFHNQRCRINCMKKGKSEYIEIDKMILPDFPDLVELKKRVSLYVVFS